MLRTGMMLWAAAVFVATVVALVFIFVGGEA